MSRVTKEFQRPLTILRHLKAMKRFLFFYIFFGGLTGNAQQWPQAGADWTYCYGPVFTWGFWGSEYRSYTRDTIVNGDLYNVLENPDAPGNEFTTYLTRYSNDTVYRWVNNQEYLFFHFQMHLGEQILTFRSHAGSDDALCTDELSLIVVDSSTVNIGTEVLTRWKLRDTMLYNGGHTDYCDYWIYERLGFISGYWFWSQEDAAICNGMILEAAYSDIGHYDDQTWFYHWQTCETSGIDNEVIRNLKIFPNPAKNQIYTSEQFLAYQIISMDGRIILNENGVGNSIVVEHLFPGAYYINFLLQNDQQNSLLFIKEN